MSSKWLGSILFLGILVEAGAGVAKLGAAAPSNLQLSDVIVVTEDLNSSLWPGCDAISVFSVSHSGVGVEQLPSLFHGKKRTSPGRLAATSDLSLILATPTNIEPLLRPSFLYDLLQQPSDGDKWTWTTQHATSDRIPSFGAVAVLPGDQTLLVAEAMLRFWAPYEVQLAEPPFRVAKYALDSLKTSSPVWGPRLGEVQVDGLAVEILPSKDRRRVHILTDRNTVFTIDPQTMRPVTPEIHLAPIKGPAGTPFGDQAPYLQHATLSGDGRYLFTNRGYIHELSVADLESRTAWTIPITSTGRIVGGVAWNSGWVNANLLVVHTFDRLIVYRFLPPNRLEEIGRIAIT